MPSKKRAPSNRVKSIIQLDDYTYTEIVKLAEYCDLTVVELMEVLSNADRALFLDFLEQNLLLD